jgi:hypothetical protein
MSSIKVAFDTIEEVSDYLDSFEQAEDAIKIAQTFADQQPAAMAYLMSRAENLDSDDEAELLLYIGNVIYLSCKKSKEDLTEVTAATIEQAEDVFLNQMRAIADMSEEDARAGFGPIFEAQPDLSTYLVGWIEQLSEDGVDEESINALYSILQVLVNAFDMTMNPN